MAYTYTNCSNCLLCSQTPSVNKARVVYKEISLPVSILKPAKNQYIERTSRNRILYFIFMKWYSILQTTGIFKRVGLFNTNVGIYNSNYRFLSGPKLMIFKVKLAIWKKSEISIAISRNNHSGLKIESSLNEWNWTIFETEFTSLLDCVHQSTQLNSN